MNKINKNILHNIIRKNLINVPEEIKKLLPSIISRPNLNWINFLTETYFLLSFIDASEKARIEKMTSKGLHPYPGLIVEKQTSDPIAFLLESSKNNIFEGCTVENMFGFSLGKDSTLILKNYKQVINTIELGPYTFEVKLSYIISFGKEITEENLFLYLEDLIAYSVNQWKSK